MDTTPGQTGPVSRGGNLSYFLFLSMMFFFMSSGPDTSSELQYRAALTRLTRERDEYKEWLFPGSVPHFNETAPDSPGSSHLGADAAVTSTSAIGAILDDGKNSTGNGTTPVLEGPHRFVLQDRAPPAALRDRVDTLLSQRQHDALYFRNVSGFFKGHYTTHTSLNISDGAQNATQIDARRGRFPWMARSARKGSEGRIVRMNIRESVPHVKDNDVSREKKNAEAAIIRGSLELELHDMLDSKSGNFDPETRTVELDLEGIHWFTNGTFFVHAAPPWRDLDMRQLPGLLLSNQTRNETAQVVLKELDARLDRIRASLATGKYGDLSGSDGDTRLNCTFSLYGHLKALPGSISPDRVHEWEDELSNPSGISQVSLPPPSMNGILFSEECNVVVELDDMEGLETERFWSKSVTYSLVLAAFTVLQTWVLVKQMEYTTTPTAIGKVSHLTIAMQVMLDVYFCVTHLTLGVVTANKASKAFLVPGFFGILSGLLFGLRYAAIIRVTTYRPEPPAPVAPAAPAQTAAAVDSNTPNAAATLNSETRRSTEVPNTTTPLLSRPAGPAPPPESVHAGTGDAKQTIAILLSAFCTISAFYFLGWFAILMVLTYSFWVPQIYHNMERGSGRNALLKKYIFVTACTRLFIPLYVWACPTNLLFIETSPWVWTLVIWQAMQVMLLCLQDKLGPRFFLPKGFWFPELDTWDYHPILPPDDIESGLVSGAEDRAGSGEKKGEVDCVICFEKVELARPGNERASLDAKIAADREPTSAMGDVFGAARRGANRMSYMVPPCHHIAHTSCLESWAAIKMECPLCRRPLPPF